MWSGGPPGPSVDNGGKQHALADYRGPLVMLEWTNHDCPCVREHYGSGIMQKLQKGATPDGNPIL